MKAKVIGLFALSSLILGCSKDSITFQNSDSSSGMSKLSRNIKDGTVFTENQSLSGSFNTLLNIGPVPDAASVDYYSVKEEVLPDSGKRLIISALTLNISENSAQDFFKRSQNVSEVVITSEKIIISTLLKFPGAKITINADELEFHGSGMISTVPESYKIIPAYGENGSPGKNGGDIILNVGKINLGSNQIRFDLSGGAGQSAGLGKPGADGASVNVISGNVIKECSTNISICTDNEGGSETRTVTCRGTDLLPQNGKDALNGGFPGVGGNGGTLFVENKFNTKEMVKSDAGEAGKSAPIVAGGKPGQPQKATLRKIQVTKSRRCNPGGGGKPGRLNSDFTIEEVIATTVGGKDSVERTVENTAIKGGQKDISAINLSEVLKRVAMKGDFELHRLEFAKDLYRNNHLEKARKILEKFSYPIAESDLGRELILNEAAQLLNQLNSNKDFFGNDLTHAPELSLEATIDIYKKDLKTSMETLSFISNMKKNVKDAEGKRNLFLQDKQKIGDQIELTAQNYEAAYQMMPALENKLEELNNSKKRLQESLERVENEIIAEAKRNIHSQERKKKLFGGLKLVAALVSASPIGAPAAQAIGASMNTFLDLSQKEEVGVTDILGEAADVYSELSDVDWKKSHQDWNSKYNALFMTNIVRQDKIDKKELQAYLKNLYATGKPLAKEIMSYYRANKKQGVPKDKYEAEIERIKAIHPLFNELVGQLNEVQEKKAEVDTLLSKISTTLNSAQGEIIRDFAMIASLESDETKFSEGLNFAIDDVLTAMERQAKNRLKAYKGAMIKAYSYRTLLPYPGSMDLERTNMQLAAFSNKVQKDITAKELEQVYLEDLAQIGKSLFDHLQSGNFREFETEYRRDFNSSELAALNEGKIIYVNFANKEDIDDSKENVRIISAELNQFGHESEDNSAELQITHMGRSILKKNQKEYEFTHSRLKPGATWITRLDLNSGESKLIKESVNNIGLLEIITGQESSSNALVFNRVGANGQFAVQLRGARNKVKLTHGSLLVKYSYSLK